MHYKMWVTDEWRSATDSEYPHGLACLKVFIGRQSRTTSGQVTFMDDSSVKPGMLVAVHCDEKEGRPFVGQVVENNSDGKINIKWLKD